MDPDRVLLFWLIAGVRVDDWRIHADAWQASIEDDGQRERAVVIARKQWRGPVSVQGREVTLEAEGA